MPLVVAQPNKKMVKNIAHNPIYSLPDSIGSLSNLLFFYISNMKLQILPPQIGKLVNLEYLNLRGNQLEGTIPEELYNLKKDNSRITAIEILKMRGAKIKKKIVPFFIQPNEGIVVHPNEVVFANVD